MKIGSVVSGEGFLFPTVPIEVHQPSGEHLRVDALLDTGFTGEVALPMSVVEGLGLEYVRDRIIALADGTHRRVEAFRASVFFGGEWRDALIYGTGGGATIGMRLVYGANISFDAVSDGDIEYRSLDLPRPRWPLHRH